eukprot:1159931-Pelagomonas_calceolata.AAC.3
MSSSKATLCAPTRELQQGCRHQCRQEHALHQGNSNMPGSDSMAAELHLIASSPCSRSTFLRHAAAAAAAAVAAVPKQALSLSYCCHPLFCICCCPWVKCACRQVQGAVAAAAIDKDGARCQSQPQC